MSRKGSRSISLPSFSPELLTFRHRDPWFGSHPENGREDVSCRKGVAVGVLFADEESKTSVETEGGALVPAHAAPRCAARAFAKSIASGGNGNSAPHAFGTRRSTLSIN